MVHTIGKQISNAIPVTCTNNAYSGKLTMATVNTITIHINNIDTAFDISLDLGKGKNAYDIKNHSNRLCNAASMNNGLPKNQTARNIPNHAVTNGNPT